MFVGSTKSCEILLIFNQIREVALESINLSVSLKAKALNNGWVITLLVLRVEVLQVNWVHEGSIGYCDREQAYGFKVV